MGSIDMDTIESGYENQKYCSECGELMGCDREGKPLCYCGCKIPN